VTNTTKWTDQWSSFALTAGGSPQPLVDVQLTDRVERSWAR